VVSHFFARGCCVAAACSLRPRRAAAQNNAAQEAIREAGKSVRGITGIDIQDWTAKVKGNKIIEYRVNAKIVFGVEKT